MCNHFRGDISPLPFTCHCVLNKTNSPLMCFCQYLQSRLQHELKKVPKLQKFWNLIKKKFDKMDADAAEQ